MKRYPASGFGKWDGGGRNYCLRQAHKGCRAKTTGVGTLKQNSTIYFLRILSKTPSCYYSISNHKTIMRVDPIRQVSSK